MDWSSVFSAVNGLALIAWIALIALPRWPALLSALTYLGVGLLCFIYAIGLTGVVTGLLPNEGGSSIEMTIAGVRGFFASDAGVTIGWTHYLAFDLFVGVWIARDADAKFFSRWLQAPILLATFLVGPIGLLIWLIIREPRARTKRSFH
ncbi:MAG: ABA4-like family protein [Pseudomonadota bacterium]